MYFLRLLALLNPTSATAIATNATPQSTLSLLISIILLAMSLGLSRHHLTLCFG